MKIRSRRVLAAARVVHRSVDLFLKKQVTRSAAALSFFLTLSIFPFLLCLNWLIGILNVDISAVGKLFGGFVPGETISIIQDYLAYIAQSRSIPMLVGGLLTMASSSSAAYRTIGNQMDSLYERRQPRRFIHWPSPRLRGHSSRKTPQPSRRMTGFIGKRVHMSTPPFPLVWLQYTPPAGQRQESTATQTPNFMV